MSNSDVVAASVNFAVAVGLVLVAMATVVTRRPALAGWRRFLDYRIWAAMTLIVAAGLDLIGFAILSGNGTLGEVGALTLLVESSRGGSAKACCDESEHASAQQAIDGAALGAPPC